jgi:glutamate 5-kinase
MRAYQESLAPKGIHTAQILLTAGDFDSRSRYLNVRNTILTLFEWGVLPIINENDTVSVAEIRFGDNDHLAALVTNLLQAPLLILLTDVAGLFSSDPKLDPNAQLLTSVSQIDGTILEMAGGSKSTLGTGGMRSKIRAARMATTAGESVIMANGSEPGILDRIFACQTVGTLFLPRGSSVPAWKRWLGFAARPKGRLVVDPGARKAIQNHGKSLLAIGIVQVQGSFAKGDVVSIGDFEGNEFARGLTNYPSTIIDKIKGMRSEQILDALESLPYEEVVHRDNLVVIV